MIKNLLSTLLIVGLLSTTACKKDSTEDKLIGTWKVQEVSQDGENILEDVEDEVSAVESTMDFDEDGDWLFSASATYDYGDGTTYSITVSTSGTWELQNDDQLIIKTTSEGVDFFATTTTLDIIELTNSKLELSGTDTDNTTVVIKATK